MSPRPLPAPSARPGLGVLSLTRSSCVLVVGKEGGWELELARWCVLGLIGWV